MNKKQRRQQLLIDILQKEWPIHMSDILYWLETEGIQADRRTIQRDIEELWPFVFRQWKWKSTMYHIKKDRLKIFISMPFTGKKYHDLVQERVDLSKLVNSFGFQLVEQFIGYQFEEDFMDKSHDPSFIVGKDKNWMKESDVVIADLTSHSIGAYQEIVLAKELFDKKVYAIVPPEKRIHYWIRFYTDFFFDSVEDALKQIKKDFDNKHKNTTVKRHQYDPIAVEYKRVEDTDVQQCVYDFELESLLQKYWKNKNIIVLHCWSWHRVRMASKYAKNVVGIDISPRQISLAEREEEKKPAQNIKYYTLDPYFPSFKNEINNLNIESADIVIGFFLLDHARSEEELRFVIDNCKYLLKKDGIFIGMVDNLEINIPSQSKYGVMISSDDDEPLNEWQSRRISICENDKEVLHFHNYARSKDTLKKIFTDNNFQDFYYRNATVSNESKKNYPDNFWKDYEKDPTQWIIVAKK